MLKKGTNETTEIEKTLEQGFVEFDKMRSLDLNGLMTLRQIKNRQIKSEIARFEKKYGENHPMTKNAAERLEFSEELSVEIEREIIRAETPTPQVDEEIWLVHGFVTDENEMPVARAIVRLFDENGKIIHTDSEAETDAKGYYSLEFDNLARLPDAVRVGISPTALSESVLSPVGGQADSAMITITDNKVFETMSSIPDIKISSGWLVTGRVLDARNEGIANLKVLIYDKDIFNDDFLGESKTDNEGIYRLNFASESFGDFFERYPEIYLVIENEAGERIYDGKSRTEYGAGRIELIDVHLKDFGSEKTGKLKEAS